LIEKKKSDFDENFQIKVWLIRIRILSRVVIAMDFFWQDLPPFAPALPPRGMGALAIPPYYRLPALQEIDPLPGASRKSLMDFLQPVIP
jgi:hypothetical protein